MTDSPTRALVRRALDELKPYLATYVAQALSEARIRHAPERPDMSALLSAMKQHWDTVFARRLTPTVRHYVFELRDVRNRWAHEEPFDEEEAQRAAHTARLVAKAIGAPRALLDRLDALGRAPVAPRVEEPAARTRTAPKASRPDGRAVARRDANGVIANAAELVADDVAMQRVLCPACEQKLFETWPFGWDAHAAHACEGLGASGESERKAEFRSRFAHLFRDEGAAARPAKQRDVMRRLWAHLAHDDERVIQAYADAERRGEVGRKQNTHQMSAEDYARALLADGLKKGWLRH